ncbi:MAG: isoprenyl transferase [Thermaerobacter sp.]|nr:isoprenyl transferase [Thermaerobacter sp.]
MDGVTQGKEAAGSGRARHVAIIMDGNGRWAAQRGLPREDGHRAGIEALRRVVRGAPNLGVEMLTVYAFSTENWRRPASEVSALMSLLVEFLESETPELAAEGVRLATIGDLSVLPQASQEALRRALTNTAGGERLLLTLALNYGGRAEIVRAAKKLVRFVQAGRVSLGAVDEQMFASLLDTHALPDPDLLIRASGEERLSNFLLWQSAYTELWVTDTFWPDFGVEHLQQALLAFASRDRRYGSHS